MPVSYLQMGGIYKNRQSPVTIYLETIKFNQDLVPCTSPKKVCFGALIIVFHKQVPAPAPSFLVNKSKDKTEKSRLNYCQANCHTPVNPCQKTGMPVDVCHSSSALCSSFTLANVKNISTYISFTNFKPKCTSFSFT